MNELQKKLVDKELKNEVKENLKENLKRKFYRFFFLIKALVTLSLFIFFEYLILTYKMSTDYYNSLQVVMLIAVAMIVSCSACIMQSIKHQCFDNLDKFCTLFAVAAITIFSFSFIYILIFPDIENITIAESNYFELACQLTFWLFIFRFLQFKTNKERLRYLGFTIPEEQSVNVGKENNAISGNK